MWLFNFKSGSTIMMFIYKNTKCDHLSWLYDKITKMDNPLLGDNPTSWYATFPDTYSDKKTSRISRQKRADETKMESTYGRVTMHTQVGRSLSSRECLMDYVLSLNRHRLMLWNIHNVPPILFTDFNIMSNTMFWTCGIELHIVLFKMFSRWFFHNKIIIMRSSVLKLCDIMDDVMTWYIVCVTFDVIHHAQSWQYAVFICWVKMQLAANFKNLPDSVGAQITP